MKKTIYAAILPLIIAACNSKTDNTQSSNEYSPKEHIAVYVNELEPFVMEYQMEDTGKVLVKNNSGEYEIAEDQSFYDLDSLTATFAAISQDMGGTGYIGRDYRHYLLLDAEMPTVAVLQEMAGSSRMSMYELREEIIYELEEEGIKEEDYSEEEFEALIEKKLQEPGEEEPNPQVAGMEEEDAYCSLDVFQKKGGKWQNITVQVLPEALRRDFAKYFPLSDAAEISDTMGVFVSFYYLNINTRLHWKTLQNIYGFKDSSQSNTMSAMEWKLKNNKSFELDVAEGNYSFVFDWDGTKFSVKTPSIPSFTEPKNCFGIDLLAPQKTVKLKGMIDNKTEFWIEATLQRSTSDECDFYLSTVYNTGKYWYSDPQKSMKIEVSICGNDNVTLYRQDVQKNITVEEFKGRLNTEKCRIEGTWTQLEKGLKKPFYLELVVGR